jgi:hypothetical protein
MVVPNLHKVLESRRTIREMEERLREEGAFPRHNPVARHSASSGA